MEYTAPAVPSIIPKEPGRGKLKEPVKTATKTAQTVKEPAEPAKDPAKNTARQKNCLDTSPLARIRGRSCPLIGSQQPVHYTSLWKRKTPEDNCQRSRSSVQTLCCASARNLFEQ
ncbi:hypothetical protein DSO57_1025409 [Entomophthora muscae]|uniref:Uncharacterized protein n=1 Tax=Entomophthora muscae TaxID=34485 RepID=A0ACC2SF81_9FUNG|nr:hypothetical protein DSO57_1025409 [Entomophthora muscae]